MDRKLIRQRPVLLRTPATSNRLQAHVEGPALDETARAGSHLQARTAVNTMRSVTSTLGSFGRLAALGATLTLAACGQNWHGGSAYVTVGGTVSGLSGGPLALWNNGGDRLAISGNGSFTFALQIATGSKYQVVVASQPNGQSCTVANGSGTATGDVRNVAVTCAPFTFTLRPLPPVYATGKAVNYSPYRAGGPAVGEVPSDADILQDLTLLHTAGYDLLRLFGVRPPGTDAVPERIIKLAGQYFPNMKFQLGVELKGITSCSDTVNDSNIAYLIGTLSKYPNVATISVGNETSFFSKYMPIRCLEGYVRTIRSQVTQPVTADDDFTFYAGLTADGGDQVAVKPDPILAIIDFVSIHAYPISRPDWWNWQQTAVPAGSERAKAMMEASLATLKDWFQKVANYKYTNASGVTVSTGASLPIVIGETGWKAVQTNPASSIETYAALPPNAKWYLDLLYGNPSQGYSSWQGSAGGPLTIFWFEATDEAWKGSDDGWGLWDKARIPRYTLCGTPVGPACNNPVYKGAGYYNPPPFSTITFDSPTVTYVLTGFAGAEDSQVVADPTNPGNRVARVIRSATAQTYAGTTVSTNPGNSAGVIPFTATSLTMTVRVNSPTAGTPVLLKVEDSGNSAHFMQTLATTTVANGWETLTFNFANPATGSPPFNQSWTYDRVTIFFNFGVAGSVAGAKTYYFDDVALVKGVYASNYSQLDASHWKSAEGGDAGNYIDTSVPTLYWWNGVAPNDAVPSYYFGYGINVNTKPWGFGAFTRAPGNGTASAAGFTRLTIAVWGNNELMATKPTLTVLMKGPTIGGCSAVLQSSVSVPGVGVQVYNVPFAGFTLQTPCAFSSVAQALAAGVAEVHVQVLGSNVQYVTGGDATGNYPNGLNIGPISFN